MRGFENKSIASNAGKKGKPGKHAKTKQWEALAGSIITTHAERFDEILKRLPDEKFANIYVQILNYFKPKLSQTQVEVDHPEIKSVEFVVKK
jgi:hypothetical protein